MQLARKPSDVTTFGPVSCKRTSALLPPRTQYMAPELIATNTLSFKTDVYALGMLLWALASSCAPFKDMKPGARREPVGCVVLLGCNAWGGVGGAAAAQVRLVQYIRSDTCRLVCNG